MANTLHMRTTISPGQWQPDVIWLCVCVTVPAIPRGWCSVFLLLFIVYRSIDRLIDWLIDWLTDWLTDWLIDRFLHSASTKHENNEDAANTQPQELHLSPLPAEKRHNESNQEQNQSSSATDAQQKHALRLFRAAKTTFIIVSLVRLLLAPLVTARYNRVFLSSLLLQDSISSLRNFYYDGIS